MTVSARKTQLICFERIFSTKVFYKSKTEERLVYTKSLNLSRNASIRYKINPTPRVANDE